MTDIGSDLILYRIGKAFSTLEDANILAKSKRWNASVNRLYYACFYAVSALLISKKMSSAKHTGVRSLFNKFFVKTGEISKDIAFTYNDLFEKRQESDYIDYVEFKEDQVLPLITNVEVFIKEIKILLQL